jgi:hypothetical protein
MDANGLGKMTFMPKYYKYLEDLKKYQAPPSHKRKTCWIDQASPLEHATIQKTLNFKKLRVIRRKKLSLHFTSTYSKIKYLTKAL